LAERVFYYAVLAGVIGDHHERPAFRQAVAERRKRACQASKLEVHGDTNGLKEASGVCWTATGAEHRTNSADQVVARLEQPGLAPTNDLPRQAGASRLVAVVLEDLGQRGLIVLVENAGGVSERVSAHAHIETNAWTKRKAALVCVDLARRNAEIEENAIEPGARQRGHLIQVSVVALERGKAFLRLIRGEARTRCGD